jgi:hypothetical protein
VAMRVRADDARRASSCSARSTGSNKSSNSEANDRVRKLEEWKAKKQAASANPSKAGDCGSVIDWPVMTARRGFQAEPSSRSREEGEARVRADRKGPFLVMLVR